MPVEFSPPLNVVNRSQLHTEEVPRLVTALGQNGRREKYASMRNPNCLSSNIQECETTVGCKLGGKVAAKRLVNAEFLQWDIDVMG